MAVVAPSDLTEPSGLSREAPHKLGGSPAVKLWSAGCGSLRFVGVEDGLYPVRIDGGRLDAGALDLQ